MVTDSGYHTQHSTTGNSPEFQQNDKILSILQPFHISELLKSRYTEFIKFRTNEIFHVWLMYRTFFCMLQNLQEVIMTSEKFKTNPHLKKKVVFKSFDNFCKFFNIYRFSRFHFTVAKFSTRYSVITGSTRRLTEVQIIF